MIRGIVTDIQTDWIEVSCKGKSGSLYTFHYNPSEVDKGLQLGDLVEVRVSKASDDVVAAFAVEEIKRSNDFVLLDGVGFSVSLYKSLQEKPKAKRTSVEEEALNTLDRNRQAIILMLDKLAEYVQ